ncbi:MAG: sec-independent translocation protein [Frankiales bacterium]|nr:sec-independent translocation protein [Frankiales bacterium]
MVDHLGLGRMAVLLVMALVVFGPDRLPQIAGQLGRGLRQVRGLLDRMTVEVKESIGPDLAGFDLTGLRPATLLTTLLKDETATLGEVHQPSAAAVALALPVGTDALSLLRDPVDVAGLVAPWESTVAQP